MGVSYMVVVPPVKKQRLDTMKTPIRYYIITQVFTGMKYKSIKKMSRFICSFSQAMKLCHIPLIMHCSCCCCCCCYCWSLEYHTPCSCRSGCPGPWTESYHLEYLQHDLGQHGEHAADAGGDETASVELLEGTGEHAQGVGQTFHSTGQNLLQSTVNTAWDVDAPVSSWEGPARLF